MFYSVRYSNTYFFWRRISMLYFYLCLPVLLLAIVTYFYFRSLRSSGVPANTHLLIDAWNATATADSAQRAGSKLVKRKDILKSAPA